MMRYIQFASRTKCHKILNTEALLFGDPENDIVANMFRFTSSRDGYILGGDFWRNTITVT